MPHDIVVIGASAGGVEALTRIVADLPADLPAALFVTSHFPSSSRSVLPQILSRSGKLAAVHPEGSERIRQGRIYVAPPDYHLMLARGCAVLSPGPKENGHRPAIDTMFRSAAEVYGKRVVGVILTGMLDDGVAGLMAIKASGGVALVQDPEDAFSSGMPQAAIKRVAVDRIVPLDQIGAAITEAVRGEMPGGSATVNEEGEELIRKEMELGNIVPPVDDPSLVPGNLTMYTCPECHGTLWEVNEGGVLRYRCHVGHAYNEDSFLSEKTVELESALWTALRTLQEHSAILKRMHDRAESRGHLHSAKRLFSNHEEAERRSKIIRNVLLNSPMLHPNGSGHGSDD